MDELEAIRADVERELERNGVPVIIDGVSLKVWIAPVDVALSAEFVLTSVAVVDIYHLPGALPEKRCDSAVSVHLETAEHPLSPPGGITVSPHRWRVIDHRRAGSTVRLRLEKHGG